MSEPEEVTTRVLRLEKERLWIRDYDGQERPVDTNSFSTPIKQGYLHKQTYILGSFFSFQGVWHSNGIATFLDIPEDEYNSYREQLFRSEEHKGRFDEFIDQFGGKRLFFFADFNAAKIIDVGTGAGFPGIPLSIISPEKEFILMDSLNKRLKIIDELCQRANLIQASLVSLSHGRGHWGLRRLSRSLRRKQAYQLLRLGLNVRLGG